MRKNLYSVLMASFLCAAIQPAISQAATEQDNAQAASISISTEDISTSAAASPIVALSGGAWVSSGAGPTLTNKGITYSLTLPVVGPVPTGSTITTVNYSWKLSTVPSGLVVYLCWNGTNCVNVSGSKTGSLGNWAGQNANVSFVYKFSVPGTGSIFPVAYGQTDQVIVNY